jgi:hypothetical protein
MARLKIRAIVCYLRTHEMNRVGIGNENVEVSCDANE